MIENIGESPEKTAQFDGQDLGRKISICHIYCLLLNNKSASNKISLSLDLLRFDLCYTYWDVLAWFL